jgi:nucleotide exchange factor SIL1
VVKASVVALKALLKSDVIRKDFLDNDGMGALLGVFLAPGGEHLAPAQQKAAFLVPDTFLDGDMGAALWAALGEWPVDDQWSDKACSGRSAEWPAPKHCWDFTVKTMAKVHKATKDHWVHDLWRQPKEARKGPRDVCRSGTRALRTIVVVVDNYVDTLLFKAKIYQCACMWDHS